MKLCSALFDESYFQVVQELFEPFSVWIKDFTKRHVDLIRDDCGVEPKYLQHTSSENLLYNDISRNCPHYFLFVYLFYLFLLAAVVTVNNLYILMLF